MKATSQNVFQVHFIFRSLYMFKPSHAFKLFFKIINIVNKTILIHTFRNLCLHFCNLTNSYLKKKPDWYKTEFSLKKLHVIIDLVANLKTLINQHSEAYAHAQIVSRLILDAEIFGQILKCTEQFKDL